MDKNLDISELEPTKRTVEFFEALLRSTPNGIAVTDASQNIVLANETFSSIFLEHWRDVIETNIFVWLDQLDGNAPDIWAELMECIYQDNNGYDINFSMTTAEEVRYLNVNASLVQEEEFAEGQSVVISIWRDITQQKKSDENILALNKSLEQRVVERTANLGEINKRLQIEIAERKQAEESARRKTELIKLQQEITLTANEAPSLRDAMQTCLHKICLFSGWPIGHVYTVGSTGILEPTDIWQLKDMRKYHRFQQISEDMSFDICVGLPGRVLANSKAHWIIDVSTDENFPRMKVARDVGIKGAFAFPVLERGKVVAVLEFFSDKVEQPDTFILEVINQLASQLGRVTERKQAEENTRKKTELIKLQQEITLTANEAPSLEDAMRICLSKICSFYSWPIGHVYMLGSTGLLKPTNIWEIKNVSKYHMFQKITEDMTFNICEGLPGRVYANAKAHWIIDVTKDEGFLRANVAMDVGIKGAFAFPVMERGGVVAILEFFSDKIEDPDTFILDAINQLATQLGRITERKQAEVKLKEAMEEALRANKAKSVFLSSMSHELRTPMNAILGFAQLLDSNCNELLSESQKKDIGHILKAGNHLLELINEVLDLSGIESGKVQISLEEIEVGATIKEVIASVEPIAEENKVTINYREENGEQFIMADNTRLKQVLINLLSNAIKYNNDGGSVSIWIEFPTEDMLRINIKDTGPGIAKENRDSLFEPFNRLGVESLNIEGTGVGLTITKKLVEMMDGSIGVESEIGKGSRFYVDFKKIESPVLITGGTEGVVEEERNAEIHKKYTMLYVEDNPANLKLVEKILERRPYITLLTAVQAEFGMDLALSNQPDMILMDINLPGMDGYEALKLLKSDDQTKEIPVIALSANAMPKDIERGKTSGFVEYITKPININKFLEVVDDILPTH